MKTTAAGVDRRGSRRARRGSRVGRNSLIGFWFSRCNCRCDWSSALSRLPPASRFHVARRSDAIQDIALFLPTGVRLPDGSGGTVFLAFHVNCPNRYLAEESVSTARENLGSYPPYFLGRVLMVERHVASEVRPLRVRCLVYLPKFFVFNF